MAQAPKGISVRQSGSAIVFRASLKDPFGNKITSGTTTLTLYEVQSDGTFKSYDFSSNTFKTTALTTATNALAHQTGNNSTTNTGIWTAALSTVTGFTRGGIYLVQVSNLSAAPPDQEREFQYGDGEGDLTVSSTGNAGSDLQTIKTQAVTATAGFSFDAQTTEQTSVAGIIAGTSGVNATKIGGTSQTGRDIGASVLLSPGTGTGQLSIASGAVTVGTNNDKTGYTASTVSDKTGYSLSGTQTFNVTGNITGNLSGSVGSVTGSVGSVTGAVGSVTGNVGGSVASVTANVNANIVQILGTAITSTIATAWLKAWNVVSSVWTSASVNQGADVNALIPARFLMTGGKVWALSDNGNPLLEAQAYVAPDNDDIGSMAVIVTQLGTFIQVDPNNAGDYQFTAAGLANGSGGSGSDPLAESVPGTYAPGTAGFTIGHWQVSNPVVGPSNVVVNAGSITILRGDTISFPLTGMASLVGNTKIWFTVKSALQQPDSCSALQIEKTAGVTYLNGTALGTPNASGGISVDNAGAGNITIRLNAASSSELQVGTFAFDVQMLDGSGDVQSLAIGTFIVSGDVTRATS